MKTVFLACGLALAGAVFAPAPARAACGKVSIADMNWSSATLIAHIDKFILNAAFDCEAELTPGDTMPTITSMTEKGAPDIAPEFWTDMAKKVVDKGVADGRLMVAGDTLSDGGEEGLWVPAYMVAKDPSLATIQGVIKHAALFKNPENPDASAIYGCPAGWACQITTANLYRALGLDKAGFDLIDPGSGAALTGSIAKAYERGEPWFGFYWAPTPILGKYKMVKVDFGVGVDEDMYHNCIAQDGCPDPKPTMSPPLTVNAIVISGFAKRAPRAYAYLQKRSFTNARMTEILAWMEDQQADGETAMAHVLTAYPDLWTAWLDAAGAAKVKKALAAF